MDISQIRKLIRLMQSTDVSEIEVAEGENKVRISRMGKAAFVPTYEMPSLERSVAAPPALEKAAGDDKHVVKSPMVGTFYRSASPEAEPFVSEGSRVSKGDTICIIEAMKLMNEIEAEYDGVVEEILVENASAVEYGQPLFRIVPA